MIKRTLVFLTGALLLFFSSCTSYKNVPYLQNDEYLYSSEEYLDSDGEEYLDSIDRSPTLFDARIMPKDLLSIAVSGSQPELAVPFNLIVPTTMTTRVTTTMTTQPSLQSYLVDNNGEIEFPVLGVLKLGGLTKGDAESMIKERLKDYFDDPIVNVRLINYKISVIGEVNNPSIFTVANEKVNVFEALAMAKDLTIYGMRENVKLIREDISGKKEIVRLNLNDANIMFSPYYYLQQNDIIYVTPNKTKARNSDISTSTTIWLTVTGTLVSVASLLVTVLR